MSATPSPSASNSGDLLANPPNWQTLQEEILCPLCDYNLRGLCEPRCPECGYSFTWAEVLDPARREHRYLIESPRRGLLRSFLKTSAAAWLPRQFWRGINPSLPIHAPRLAIYWCLACLPFLAAMTIRAIEFHYAVFVYQGFAIADVLQNVFVFPTLTILLWPLPLFLTLMIFQVSMRRARVRPRHVLRCVIYGGGSLFAFSLVTCILAAWQFLYILYPPVFTIAGPSTDDWLTWTTLAWLLLSTWSLAQAYRHYLRFDHPLATAIVSQLIVFLFYTTLYFRLGGR